MGLFTLLSFILPEQGVISGALIDFLKRGFGWGTLVIPVALLVAGGWMLSRKLGDRYKPPNLERIIGGVFLFFAMLIVLHAVSGGSNYEQWLEAAREGRGGGAIGALLLSALNTGLGASGTVIVMLAWVMIGLTLTSGTSVPELLEVGARASRWLRQRTPSFSLRPQRSRSAPPVDVAPPPKSKAPDRAYPPTPLKTSATPVQETPHMSVPTVARGTSWTLPPLTEILEPGIEGKVDAAFDRDRGRVIEETLLAFGAPARVVEINRGPTITQFGIEPDYLVSRGGKRTKVKVSKISALADDLALALAARSIRIEAPVPGKGFIGVEVPNTEISLVSLRDVMESERF